VGGYLSALEGRAASLASLAGAQIKSVSDAVFQMLVYVSFFRSEWRELSNTFTRERCVRFL